MSDWLPLITLIVFLFGPLAVVWLKGKMEKQMKDHSKLDIEVKNRVEFVASQNVEQLQKIANVHIELNNCLDQWREDIANKIKDAVKIARQEGIEAGIALEKQRNQ